MQDTAKYLGSVYKKYHTLIYERNGTLPEIQLENLAIDYNEIYRRAMEDYIDAIVNKKPHAVTASFVLPSLIERGLVISLQNKLLDKAEIERRANESNQSYVNCQRIMKAYLSL